MVYAVDIHDQPSLKDEDNYVPTPQGKSTAHDVRVKEVLPEIKQKGLAVVIDHHEQCGARVCDVNRGEGQGGDGRRWPSRGEEKRKSII